LVSVISNGDERRHCGNRINQNEDRREGDKTKLEQYRHCLFCGYHPRYQGQQGFRIERLAKH
jgi:hypothetical protein